MARDSDEAIVDRFHAEGQGHVFRFLQGLDAHGRARLLRSARAIDLRVVRRLAKGEGLAKPHASFEPLGGADFCRREDLERDPALRARAEETGRNLLRSGAVACITVAGARKAATSSRKLTVGRQPSFFRAFSALPSSVSTSAGRR